MIRTIESSDFNYAFLWIPVHVCGGGIPHANNKFYFNADNGATVFVEFILQYLGWCHFIALNGWRGSGTGNAILRYRAIIRGLQKVSVIPLLLVVQMSGRCTI